MIIGLGGFLFFSILAMVFYSGGSEFDPNTPAYNFFSNYLSDLGLVSTPSGQLNMISLSLFTIAMFLIGILSIPFMTSFYQQFPKKSVARYIAFLGGISGLISAFGYIGVGLTPLDQVSSLHSLSVSIAFGGTLWTAFLFAIAIFLSRILPKKYGLFLFGIAVIISLFIVLQIIVAGSWNPFVRTLTVVGQKITVYFQIFLLFLVGRGILHTYSEDAGKSPGLLGEIRKPNNMQFSKNIEK